MEKSYSPKIYVSITSIQESLYEDFVKLASNGQESDSCMRCIYYVPAVT